MWDARYLEGGFAYGTKPNDFLVSSAEFMPPGACILSLGEGEGRNGVFLAEQGHSVIAVDGSRVGLAKTRQLARSRGVVVQTEEADLSHYTIPPLAYDGIISIFCHLLPDARTRLYAQVNQALQPGGIFILEGFAKRQVEFDSGGPKNPEMLLELDQLKRELAPLEIKYGVELIRDVYEGRYHTGRAAVVQLIGIRT